MKNRVLSDLHLEFADWTPPRRKEDVVVLACDLPLARCAGDSRRRAAQRCIRR